MGSRITKEKRRKKGNDGEGEEVVRGRGSVCVAALNYFGISCVKPCLCWGGGNTSGRTRRRQTAEAYFLSVIMATRVARTQYFLFIDLYFYIF